MHSTILTITFDCTDARAQTMFWAAATGGSAHERDSPRPGTPSAPSCLRLLRYPGRNIQPDRGLSSCSAAAMAWSTCLRL
jgi:hypothetical protein